MLTGTDLFCGGGGSTSGAEEVPGVRVLMAANHWKLAVDTHNTNHPHADHDCADLSQVDPRRYPTTDWLWASPECTNHSQAKGKKRATTGFMPDAEGNALPLDAAERSRATMWDVVRFTEYHRYKFVIVENVVEATQWVPFKAWLQAMDSLGYHHEIIYLNSMHAQGLGDPAPQSRDRVYINFWRKGQPRPELERATSPAAWCPSCETVIDSKQTWKKKDRPECIAARYRQQYIYTCPTCSTQVEPGYLPAATIIDWSLTGERIGDRKRPLADKTMARIEAGLRKHLFTPLGVPVEGREGKQAFPMWGPLRTQTARAETGLLVPAGGTWRNEAAPLSSPAPTRTTRDNDAVLMPFITTLRGGGSKLHSQPVTLPTPTFSAGGNHHGLVMPGFVMRNNGSKGDGGEHCTPLSEVVRTITTKGHQSVVTWDALMPYNRTGNVRPLHQPAMTMTTVDTGAVLASAPNVEDCYFRMLQPHEVARAMAFGEGYVLLGNKRERVRMCGNAVTPPAARDLVAIHAEALQGGVSFRRPSEYYLGRAA